MVVLRGVALSASVWATASRSSFAAARSSYGRACTYQRLLTQIHTDTSFRSSSLPLAVHNGFWKSDFEPYNLAVRLHPQKEALLFRRHISSSTARLQQAPRSEEIRDPPGEEQRASGKTSKASASTEPGASSEEKQSKRPEGEAAGGEETADEKEKKEEEKDEPPLPPPPHGDKTPWQVFTETLRSEFKASKEWNESTKALASSAHQFSENDSVKKARAAYEAASGAASSKTSSALKNTGKALGQGAAWTWETPVVKGLRTGVNLTGRGIEKATRPIRETDVYKSAVGTVKDVVDDGSSSRYGGWTEKEERRRQRELRELNELKSGKRAEKMEEDPKYMPLLELSCSSLC